MNATAQEQIEKLVRDHVPGDEERQIATYVRHFGHLFDESGNLYRACLGALEDARGNVRSPGGFIFAFLRGVENAGGYEAWLEAEPKPEPRGPITIDVPGVIAQIRAHFKTAEKFTDDEIADVIAKTAHLREPDDFVLGSRVSVVGYGLVALTRGQELPF